MDYTQSISEYAATKMVLALAILSLLLFSRTCYVLWNIRTLRKRVRSVTKRTTPARTLVVLGSGGHTTEMISLTQNLDPSRYILSYVKASTDTTSVARLPNVKQNYVYNIPRSREVGQSYLTSIITTLHAALYSMLLMVRLRPNLLLCNGPGTCLPLCVAGLLLRILGIADTQVVFVESFCRVKTLSLTGKLLYHWADLFVVHWPELHQQYPQSVLVSSFVSNDKKEH